MKYDRKASGSRNKEVDMLNGPLLGKIIVFAIPLALSSLMQQLFNSIDVAVVGHYATKEALAAVGSNAPVINLMINLFVGISMGANVVLSNHIGQNDGKRIKNAISTIGLMAIASGMFIMLLGITTARTILEFIGTPDGVLGLATTYLRIYFCGIPFLMIFNFASAILRSLGNTRTPLYILLAAGIVNTILNLIFVIVFNMSVSGVAIATCVSNLLSALMIVRVLMKTFVPYTLHPSKMFIKSEELKNMLKIGVPAGLQGMIFSFSNLLLQSAINSYGAAAIAGSAASLNFESYCYFVMTAFNGAAISFTGQNYGAGKYDRVRRIFWICLAMGFISCFSLNMLIAWKHDICLSVFSTDQNVISYGSVRILIVLTTQSIACTYELPGAAMRGMGKSVLPTLITIIGTCMLRVIWIFVIAKQYNSFGVLMMVYPVSWIATGGVMVIGYYATAKKCFNGR